MSSTATITVLRPLEQVERLWGEPRYRSGSLSDSASVAFTAAPGDRGTEIRVEFGGGSSADGLGAVVRRVVASPRRAKAMDELRRFKQLVETGVVTRSDGAPEGERAQRKFKQRPAQPLGQGEIEKAGVR